MTAVLKLDPTLCDGHGFCFELLPGLLTEDDWGYPIVGSGREVPVPDHLVGEARRAVRDCPVNALRVVRPA